MMKATGSLPGKEERTRAREEISEHVMERGSHMAVTVREVVTQEMADPTEGTTAEEMIDVVLSTGTTEVQGETTTRDLASTAMREEMTDVPSTEETTEDHTTVMTDVMAKEETSTAMTDATVVIEEKVATGTSREETDAHTTKKRDATTQA